MSTLSEGISQRFLFCLGKKEFTPLVAFFPLNPDPVLDEFVVKRSKQEVIKVVSLSNNSGKHEIVPLNAKRGFFPAFKTIGHNSNFHSFCCVYVT